MPNAFALHTPDQPPAGILFDEAPLAAELASCAANEAALPLCIVALDRVGALYCGNLIEDVLRYRALRDRRLRGEPFDEGQERALANLEERLRQPPGGAGLETRLRAYYRYSCRFPAAVRTASGDLEVTIEDVSAGGVKAVAEHLLRPGQAVFLRVPTMIREQPITFPSRVAWVTESCFGLMFAGPARRATGIGAVAR